MNRPHSRRQQGIALIAFLAIVAIGVSALILKHLNDESGLIAAVRKNRNAEVLNRAKQALIGYVAHQAAVSGENNPGAFPCPEAPAGYGSTTGTDGKTQSPSCTLPAVGRFPWRTIGTDMLVDSAGEPLWYVVASGWSKPSAAGNTVINSNCTDAASAMTCFTGQLTVDGVANAAVALIIAPGPAFKTAVAAGCTTAVNQVRSAVGPPDLANYLECDNATNPADANFVTTGPSAAFNDQVVKITAAEVLPVIEGAIAERFQKEFALPLRTNYSAAPWPVAQVLPFAAAFGNPTTDPGRKLQGAAVISSGTAAVSNGSATVTLSASATPSLAGRHFRVQGSTSAYLISAHTSGTSVLTLASAFTGATSGAASYQIFVAGGLLPANYAFDGQCTCASPPCVCPTPAACNITDPRCDPAFVTWRSAATLTSTGGASLDASSSCAVGGSPPTLTCTLNTYVTLLQLLTGVNWMTFNLDATADNAGMTWRKVNAPMTSTVALASTVGVAIGGIDTTYVNSPFGYDVTSLAMNTDGSATLRVNARVQTTGAGSPLGVLGALTCSIFGIPLCYKNTVTLPMAMLGDLDVFDPNNATTNWFFRNRWHEVSYYAVAPNVTPSGPHSCVTSTTCLQVSHHVNDGKQRGVLVFGGAKIAAQARPALVASDLLDGANAGGASPFEQRSGSLAPNRAFNDRFAVIDTN